MKKQIKENFSTFLKGLAMGSVDIIPGISGGTMALILKIYTKIINELKLINFDFFKKIVQLKIKEAFLKIDWRFLLILFFGIITAIISLARIIDFTLKKYPEFLYSFFFGLILLSAILLARKEGLRNKYYFYILIGFILAWIISTLSPAQSPENYLFIFLSGSIAICAMILPGISGAFILMLLGKYEFMISALKNPFILNNFIIITIFLIGCIFGLLSFVKVLSYVIKNHYKTSLAILIGFMLGALNKIWPFKKTIENIIIDNQEIVIKQKNILPETTEKIFFFILFFSLGFVVAYLIQKIEKNKK